MSKVTVYIPNFNYGKYIETAIQSVLIQSHENIKILVIDDGSTDDSTSKISKYIKEHQNIQLIKNVRNVGLVSCCNLAVMACNTEYIFRLDGDDWLEIDAIEELIWVAEKTRATIVYPEYFEHHRNGETVHVEHGFLEYGDDHAPHGACCLIRTDFLKKLGGYDDEFSCHDGFFLWLKANYHRKKIVFYSVPLFTYYRHPTSLSSKLDEIKKTKEGIFLKHA